jgi:hypothetical protein
LTAEYFHRLQYWLEKNYDNLRTVESWEKLFIHLACILAEMANDQNDKEYNIEVNKIMVPTVQDLFQMCRLMYQAIGTLRTGICDGQHRMGAVLNLLCGWKIKQVTPVDVKMPPMMFVARDEESNFDKNEYIFDQDSENKLREKYQQILNSLSGKVVVRVMVPDGNDNDFQKKSVSYSFGRDDSQRSHKPRVLVNL